MFTLIARSASSLANFKRSVFILAFVIELDGLSVVYSLVFLFDKVDGGIVLLLDDWNNFTLSSRAMSWLCLVAFVSGVNGNLPILSFSSFSFVSLFTKN